MRSKTYLEEKGSWLAERIKYSKMAACLSGGVSR